MRQLLGSGSTLELYGHTQSHVLAESFWIPLS